MGIVNWLALAVAAVVMAGTARAGEPDRSTAKEWAFGMQKVWEVQRIGENELLHPGELRVADDGTLYFRDFGRNVSYIIDADGKPVGTFAPQGNGEGEVPFYLNCFPASECVVICTPDKLHFFTKQGQFIKAVPNNPFLQFPLAFRDTNEFWAAPGALGDAPGGHAAVTHINLTSGEETTVCEFALSDEEKKPSGGAVIVGMTPQAKMGLDSKSDRVYFGKNSDTIIYWVGGDSGKVDSFSFAGTRQPVSETDKRNHFAKFNVPEQRVAALIGAMPDRMAYYDRIQVVDGMVYLFLAECIGRVQTTQVVNVFSPDGRYLYYGRIQVEEGWHVYSGPENLQLGAGSVYVVQENDTGALKIVKYRVTVPRL